jgi:hypothetical protein
MPSEIPSETPSIEPSIAPSLSPSMIDTVSNQQPVPKTPPIDPSPSPNALVCGNYTVTQRAIALYLDIAELSGEGMLDDLESNQAKALQWIIYTDALQVCPEDSNVSQRYILALLYVSTNGDGWNECTKAGDTTCAGEPFLSGTNECQWGGVSCDSEGLVTKINIGKIFVIMMDTYCKNQTSHMQAHNCVNNLFPRCVTSDKNNMDGSIPEEIAGLDSLVELGLDKNALTGSIPLAIGKLPQLQFLDLDENKLSGTIPDELYNATTLRSIDLDSNNFSGSISTKIGDLVDLFLMQLDYNLLTGEIPSEVASLSNLRKLLSMNAVCVFVCFARRQMSYAYTIPSICRLFYCGWK